MQVNCSDAYNGQNDGYAVDVWYEMPAVRPIITAVGSDAGGNLQILYRKFFEKGWMSEAGAGYQLAPGEEQRVRNGTLFVKHLRLRWANGSDPGKVWLVGCDLCADKAIIGPAFNETVSCHNRPAGIPPIQWTKYIFSLKVLIFAFGLCLCSTFSVRLLWKCCRRCSAHVLSRREAGEHIEVPLLGVINTVNGSVPLQSDKCPSRPAESTSSFSRRFGPSHPEEITAEVELMNG